MMIYWRDFSANDTVSVAGCAPYFYDKVSTQTIRQSVIAQLREAFGSAAAKLECEILRWTGSQTMYTCWLPTRQNCGQCDGQ